MRTVGEIAGWLEDFAPSRLAESWDNVGLLWGDPDAQVARRDDLPDRHAEPRPPRRSPRGPT